MKKLLLSLLTFSLFVSPVFAEQKVDYHGLSGGVEPAYINDAPSKVGIGPIGLKGSDAKKISTMTVQIYYRYNKNPYGSDSASRGNGVPQVVESQLSEVTLSYTLNDDFYGKQLKDGYDYTAKLTKATKQAKGDKTETYEYDTIEINMLRPIEVKDSDTVSFDVNSKAYKVIHEGALHMPFVAKDKAGNELINAAMDIPLYTNNPDKTAQDKKREFMPLIHDPAPTIVTGAPSQDVIPLPILTGTIPTETPTPTITPVEQRKSSPKNIFTAIGEFFSGLTGIFRGNKK